MQNRDQNHDQRQRNIGEGAQQGQPPKKAPQHEQQDQAKQDQTKQDQIKHQPGHGNRVPDQGKG